MIYDLIAPFYDAVNKDINYSEWADFIEQIIQRDYKLGKPELALDLGCGTGKMTIELASRGYDMTGIDISVEMLDIAKSEAEKMGLDILWLCQDITSFELYGTVDVAVSCLDTVNHITSKSDLVSFLLLVHNYLIPDGLFIFDINGKYKFENIYAEETYVMEENGSVCIWQNNYDPKSKLCDFLITIFTECDDGRYVREEEMQTEKMYTVKQMSSVLTKSGFELIGAYSDYAFSPADDSCERIYFVARCKK